MATLGKRNEITIIPGVSPYEDSTPLDTLLFTDTDKVRFQNGKLRKIGGWSRILSMNFQRIYGAARNIFSTYDNNGNPITLIGTSYALYAYQFGLFYNITPLQTTAVTLTDPITTEYKTGNYDIITTAGSSVVTLDIPNYFNNGQLITISGVGSDVNGIPAADFNKTSSVIVLSDDTLQINLADPATSSGTVSVNFTWASNYIYVNYPAHGLTIGDRISITGSSSVDGISGASINIENIVTRIVDLDNFVIPVGQIATSLATGGGTISLYEQLPPGETGESSGYGYGAAEYGSGIYGSALQGGIIESPRIWSMDKFGTIVVLTPGDPATSTTPNLYQWGFDLSVAPVLISGAPNAVKWVYVSSNIICTLGSGGIPNKFYASGIADQTAWTPGPSNVSYINTIEQSGPLISQGTCRVRDLIFSQNDVYQFFYVGPPVIWAINKIFSTDGIIGPKARVEIEDAVFWMGQGDFYVYDGYSVNVLPNNTVKRFVYDNLNSGQGFKAFAYANVEFNEIWWFYPSGDDTECNNYVIFNYKEQHWTIGTLSRSAGEEPTNVNDRPLMIQSLINNVVFVPNSFNSFFYSDLETDPITTTDTSSSITINVSLDSDVRIGDSIDIEGSTDVGGILAADINGHRTVTAITEGGDIGYGSGWYGVGDYGTSPNVTVDTITVTAGSAATSTATGGGSSVTIGTQIIGLQTNLTTVDAGDTITITGVSNSVGGIPPSDINGTFTVRTENNGYIEFSTTGYATSSEYDAGGIFAKLIYQLTDRLFQHETGVDDYNPDFDPNVPGSNPNAPMDSYAQTNYVQVGDGDVTGFIYRIYPDMKVTGEMTLTINGRLYADTPTFSRGPIVITPTTPKIDAAFRCRQRQYMIRSDVLGGNFLIGKWYEESRPSAPR